MDGKCLFLGKMAKMMTYTWWNLYFSEDFFYDGKMHFFLKKQSFVNHCLLWHPNCNFFFILQLPITTKGFPTVLDPIKGNEWFEPLAHHIGILCCLLNRWPWPATDKELKAQLPHGRFMESCHHYFQNLSTQTTLVWNHNNEKSNLNGFTTKVKWTFWFYSSCKWKSID